MKYRAYQYVPSIDISEQYVSKLWIILQLVNFFFLELMRIHACRDFV